MNDEIIEKQLELSRELRRRLIAVDDKLDSIRQDNYQQQDKKSIESILSKLKKKIWK